MKVTDSDLFASLAALLPISGNPDAEQEDEALIDGEKEVII